MFERNVYSMCQKEKDAFLLERLSLLTAYHYDNCNKYRNIIDNLYSKQRSYLNTSEIPYIPVSLFKKHKLVSVSEKNIVTTLTSSGTSGQQTSKIFLDRETSKLQSTALVKIMSEILGNKRIPMIIIDTKSVLNNRESITARGAGIVGMMNFGSRPFFALNDDMTLDVDGLNNFLNRYGASEFFMFGFTFIVWCYFYEQIHTLGLDLSHGTLIHSGGWKKMLDRKVDNVIFKRSFKETTGLHHIYNFYGMAEQVGSVFVEGEDGFLYPPYFADVIIRDPKTMKPAEIGQEGLVQVLSCLPKSYPGHSLLTEDIGVIHHIDKGSKLGKGFHILGRVPKAEVRGCSDTHEVNL